MGPLRYRLPSRISTRAVLARLGDTAIIAAEPGGASARQYLDTADWRLYGSGRTLEVGADRWGAGTLTLRDARSGEVQATAEMENAPAEARDLPWDPVRSVIEGRRLLVQATAQARLQRLAVLNPDAKTVARVFLDRFVVVEPAGGRHVLRFVTVVPVRGYSSWAARITAALEEMGLQAAGVPLIVSILAATGRAEPGADRGPGVPLEREMPAAAAVGAVLERLRNHVVANEEGVRQQLDIEFLHDYRVAVRRARSMVRQAGGILPAGQVSALAGELGWLGALTGPPRDLDVHLEELEGRTERELEPLRAYLAEKRQHAQLQLLSALDSERYKLLIDQWQSMVSGSPGPYSEEAPDAGRPAGEVADEHVARAYRRVLKRGRAIHAGSPAEALHDLRKRAKELRYLLECFQTLYPDHDRTAAVKELKLLQENLGEYQDCQVQAVALQTMADELMERRVPAATLMALGRQTDELERREAQAREEFEARFARFSSARNRRRLESLVGMRT
ncbi:MAG: CHAD domain-containing protein [Acidimicrobiales bacterium]|nr:CHAD domain-containing protein [Acidimicrobiales bacterium]